jgi:probable F420-dependent oxidoreductase
MKLGVTIPNHWGVADVHQVLELAVEAETLGFDSIWTMDHLLNVGRVRERLEDRPYWHPMGVLSAAAVMTSRIELGTSVMVLPYHDPVGMAKYAATLDALSRGRFILGVGVGALREEFDALGVPFGRRGAMTDEAIAVMQDLWTNPSPDYQGGRYAVADLKFAPRPIQQPRLPLWIGGSSPAAVARTARVGDGWHPSNIDPQTYGEGAAVLREQATARGRDPAGIVLSARVDVDTAQPADATHVGRLWESIARYGAAGVSHMVLALTSGEVPRLREWMQAVASARPKSGT